MGRFVLLLLGTLLVGCGPHLNSQLRLERAYRASADCSQGPFEVHVPALGSKWGEELELRAVGPAIRGELKVAGPVSSAGTDRFGPFDPQFVHNERCRLVPADVAAPASSADAEWAAPTFHAPAPAPAAVTPATAAVAAPPPALVETELPKSTYGGTSLVNYSFPVDRLDGVPLQAGAEFVITFWSLEPNDLRDVVFVLTQKELVPSVPEAEWVAHLQHERDEARAEQQKQQREADEESRRWREKEAQRQHEAEARSRHWNDCARHRETKDCDDVRGEIDTAIAESERIQQQEQHRQWCYTHLYDSSCAEQRAADEARRHRADCRAHLERADCADLKAEAEAAAAATRRQQEDRVRMAEGEARVKHVAACRPHPNAPECADVRAELRIGDPGRPPPAPLAEEQPPRPSPHADWVPGRWVWDGWDFQWTGGGWNVPDSDRAAKLTVVAPAPPPEPKLEAAVAQPVGGAVWVPGAWQWNGAGWVWVRGVWRMPPRVGLRWRPPAWVVDARGVRLDPGGWMR